MALDSELVELSGCRLFCISTKEEATRKGPLLHTQNPISKNGLFHYHLLCHVVPIPMYGNKIDALMERSQINLS